MEKTSEQPTITSAPLPSKWRRLVFGAGAAAVLIVIAYGIITMIRDRHWAEAARQQAKLFVQSSPVLSHDLGPITTMRQTAEERASGSPPTYEVDFQVTGQKAGGTVEIKLQRSGPQEWLVSSAKLERGDQTHSLL